MMLVAAFTAERFIAVSAVVCVRVEMFLFVSSQY